MSNLAGDNHINKMDPPPLPFQLRDPERLRQEFAAAGLKDLKVETITETTEFKTGKDLWEWIVWSNPIAEMLLGSLSLTNDERGVIQQALEKMVRERAGGSGAADSGIAIVDAWPCPGGRAGHGAVRRL